MDIWQTVPEPTPEERVVDVELKTQAHEAAVVAAINVTAPEMPFSAADQKVIEDTFAGATLAIRGYSECRRTQKGPEGGDDRVQGCRRALINAGATMRQRQRDMHRLQDAEDRRCAGKA